MDRSFDLKDLATVSHVMLRTDAQQPPLRLQYSGPHKVLERGDKTFRIEVAGKPATVSIDRLKPAYILPGDEPLPGATAPRPPTLVQPVAQQPPPAAPPQTTFPRVESVPHGRSPLADSPQQPTAEPPQLSCLSSASPPPQPTPTAPPQRSPNTTSRERSPTRALVPAGLTPLGPPARTTVPPLTPAAPATPTDRGTDTLGHKPSSSPPPPPLSPAAPVPDTPTMPTSRGGDTPDREPSLPPPLLSPAAPVLDVPTTPTGRDTPPDLSPQVPRPTPQSAAQGSVPQLPYVTRYGRLVYPHSLPDRVSDSSHQSSAARAPPAAAVGRRARRPPPSPARQTSCGVTATHSSPRPHRYKRFGRHPTRRRTQRLVFTRSRTTTDANAQCTTADVTYQASGKGVAAATPHRNSLMDSRCSD